MSTKNKGNPVPSIGKKLEQTLKIIGNPKWFDDYKYGFSEGAKYLAKILQNGVETDNEQPKSSCTCYTMSEIRRRKEVCS